ncbi:MAG: 2,3-bisphosphoglycerate-independent phosphoglycerate mutase [Candidatus Pacebacteria bacterium]|nr:2,3-bisphosphoglycerate-independent phosphoglycerate mutase [Candidatus Paceibacterota bacterium]
MFKKPTNILIILDGWGVASKNRGNAIELAKKPFFDNLVKKYPYTMLNATGLAVGLSENERSGSEAGHLNIGAGRIIKQDSQIIREDIESGKFYKNPRILRTMNHALVEKRNLHFVGLLSELDSPHSDPDHIYALLRLAKQKKIKQVFLHLFTDGRDTYKKRALIFLKDLDCKIKEIGIGKIVTIGGRYYGMDRVKHWDRMQRAYDVMVLGEGIKNRFAEEAVENAYKQGLTDEFIIPTVVVDEKNKPIVKIKNNDAIIFFNVRGDRARQFTKLFVLDDIVGYENRSHKLKNIFACTLTDFGPDLPVQVAYSSQAVKNTIPYILKDFKQLYIAEAEKYPHITYFFNGGHKNIISKEDREKIPSPNVFSYDQQPEMSSADITKVIASNIEHSVYDFIVVNYANADMVGHTGNLKATITAVEFLDKCLKQVIEKILESGGTAIVTADHGNADEMIDLKTGEEMTMHSKNPVPFILIKNEFRKENLSLRSNGILGNVSPTLLDVLKIEKPEDMVLGSLIEK